MGPRGAKRANTAAMERRASRRAGQQDEALRGRSGQGLFQRPEDGVDRLGELAVEPLELAAAQAGLAGRLAALLPRESSPLATALAVRSGLLAAGRAGFSARLRSQPSAGWRLYWPWQPPCVRCEGSFLPSIAPGRLTSAEPEKRQESNSGLIVALDLTDPDVAEADGVAVILQHDGAFGPVGAVGGAGAIGHGAEVGRVVVDKDAVVQHGGIGRRFE